MRILHTADWHLGARLGVHDRTDDMFRQAERVLQLAEEHHADLLLVAGDLFDHRTNPALTKRLADFLGPYVRRGLQVLLMPGNHDNREHFRMMRALLTLEQGQSGRIHVVQTAEIVPIGGVQFATIPYPIGEMLEPHHPEVTGRRERNVVLSTAYANLVRAMVDRLDPRLPTVFAAHITVGGATTVGERELTYDDDIRLGTGDLPYTGNTAYIALGHIHQQQVLRHTLPCWYSGSIDRLNMGERDDSKGVLLVDVPEVGPASVKPLALEATPFYDIVVPAAELDTLPVRYNDLDRAFVRVTIDCTEGAHLVALQRRARELCPRCTEVRFTGVEAGGQLDGQRPPSRDYRTAVLDYLHETLAENPALPELERRALGLVEEVSHALADD